MQRQTVRVARATAACVHHACMASPPMHISNALRLFKPLLLLTRRAGQADMATGDRLVVASRALVADGAGIQAVDVCQTRPDMVTFVPGGRQR